MFLWLCLAYLSYQKHCLIIVCLHYHLYFSCCFYRHSSCFYLKCFTNITSPVSKRVYSNDKKSKAYFLHKILEVVCLDNISIFSRYQYVSTLHRHTHTKKKKNHTYVYIRRGRIYHLMNKYNGYCGFLKCTHPSTITYIYHLIIPV